MEMALLWLDRLRTNHDTVMVRYSLFQWSFLWHLVTWGNPVEIKGTRIVTSLTYLTWQLSWATINLKTLFFSNSLTTLSVGNEWQKWVLPIPNNWKLLVKRLKSLYKYCIHSCTGVLFCFFYHFDLYIILTIFLFTHFQGIKYEN